ncbi:tetratricopeptide repeat protein [Desulfamplus magnetovallimortis]|nr:hypothetical protein [Desulfamplus magnetovallimortis]
MMKRINLTTTALNYRLKNLWIPCPFNSIFILFLSFSLFLFDPIIEVLHSSSPATGEETLTINSDMQFNYAMELFASGDFTSSVVELSRFIHFFPDNIRVKEARLQKGFALYKLKRFPEALNEFKALATEFYSPRTISLDEKLSSTASDEGMTSGTPDNIIIPGNSGDPIQIEALFMTSATFLAIKRDVSAEVMLHNLLLLYSAEEKADIIKIKDHALYSLAWIYFGRAEQQHASMDEKKGFLLKGLRYLDKISISNRARYQVSEIVKDIQETIEKMKINGKKPILSGILSIIPGGGFSYCNRYHDALAAMMVNAALIFASVRAFEDENAALGGILGVIEFGFYGGNIYGGISSAHKHNQQLVELSMNELHKKFRHRSFINLHLK